MAPSLVNLCVDSLKLDILRGGDEDLIRAVFDLPTELFDCLLNRLPALALHILLLQLPHSNCDYEKFDIDCLVDGRKRVRCHKFNVLWMELFHSRWPEIFLQFKEKDASEKEEMIKLEAVVNWQQKYWETHLQCCLDAAAEKAMLPYCGNYKLLQPIGYEGEVNGSSSDYSKLLGHCQNFGLYARSLRLQNVHCTAETSHLLRESKLENLVIRKISTKMQVYGLCKILMQNIDTLVSLEFVDCKLSSDFMDAIYDALHPKNAHMHGLEEFEIRASKLYEAGTVSLPVRLVSLVLSGRSLTRFSFCDNHIDRNLTSLIMKSVLDASFGLHCADTSENSNSDCFYRQVPHQPSSLLDVGNSLQSLQVLNLRYETIEVCYDVASRESIEILGNNLTKNDIKDLKSALINMPMLETLDLSDNPFGDNIIRCIPIFTKTSKSTTLANLFLNNCRMSVDGATDLLEALSDSNCPLKCLSLADNNLGSLNIITVVPCFFIFRALFISFEFLLSKVAAPLARFLGTPINTLHIGEIGLGSDGFLVLERSIREMVNIVSIDISANRGGVEAAKFLAKLLRCAPKLVSVIAAYNIMPKESLTILYSALKVVKGKLQHIDLMGNPRLCKSSDLASMFGEFRYNDKPIVIMPDNSFLDAYDDDP
ncbi:LOW QUALITY PROTEIN: hypothetical protein V2J09_000488 [Rumex salicifolius]